MRSLIKPGSTYMPHKMYCNAVCTLGLMQARGKGPRGDRLLKVKRFGNHTNSKRLLLGIIEIRLQFQDLVAFAMSDLRVFLP